MIFSLNQQQCEAGVVQELIRTVVQGGKIKREFPCAEICNSNQSINLCRTCWSSFGAQGAGL